MFGLEIRGETLIFMLHHSHQTMTILILHFLHFGALINFTGDFFFFFFFFCDKNKTK